MDKIKRKLCNKLWKEASHVINKKGKRIFDFSYLREKFKENNITKNDFDNLDRKLLKPDLLKVMSIEEFTQWIWNPTQKQLEAEEFLISSFDGTITSTSSSIKELSQNSSSESNVLPPLSN